MHRMAYVGIIASALTLTACTPAPAEPAPPAARIVAVPVPVAVPVVRIVQSPPVVITEYVTEYVETPTYELDPITGLPVTAQLLLDREDAAYAVGRADAEAERAGDYERGYEAGAARASEAILQALATPCEFEDSFDCYWNGSARGNGDGRTFINAAGWTFYLD